MKNIRPKDLKCENSAEMVQDEINLCWLDHEYSLAVADRGYWNTILSQTETYTQKIRELQLEQQRLERLVNEIRHAQAELDGIDSVEPYKIDRMTQMPYEALLEIFGDMAIVADSNFGYRDYLVSEVHEELARGYSSYLDKYVKNNRRGKYKS